MAKAVLAFSGGLGTMAALHVLKKKKGLSVVTFTANMGQKGSTEQAGEKALQVGADSAHVGDLREKFVEGVHLAVAAGGCRLRVGLCSLERARAAARSSPSW